MSGLIRRLAERASREARFRARLPKRFGHRPIWLSPGNHLAVLKPGERKFEAYLLGFVDRFVDADSIVWDIGANMGMFAVPAAHRAKKTIAFEPDTFNVALLQRTLRDNPDLALDVLPVALANAVGVARFAISNRGRSANSLEGKHFGSTMGGIRQQVSVMTVTADWAMEQFGPPTFVKCDAEGAEALILQGASRVLAEARPLIVVEMPAENSGECAEIFSRHEYVTMSAYARVSAEGAVERIDDVWDVLAIPRERHEGLIGR